MRRLLKVNPLTVIDVITVGNDFTNEEIKDDEYKYICRLINNESVLLSYNPLLTIKQFIKYRYAITSDSNELNVKVEKTIVYINYYGFEVEEISDNNSNNEIRKVYETSIRAYEILQEIEYDEGK